MRQRIRGFTLLELLVVLAILSLLLGILVPRFTRASLEAQRSAAKTRIEALELMTRNYEVEQGDFPPSRLEALGIDATNLLDEGVEALTVALFLPEFRGPRPDEEQLGNTDDDGAEGIPTILGSSQLFEILDPWGNPYAYFHHRDYGDSQVYRLQDAYGEDVEQAVEAVRNPETGTWYRPESFQILSAGPDGTFGTDDDVTPWS